MQNSNNYIMHWSQLRSNRSNKSLKVLCRFLLKDAFGMQTLLFGCLKMETKLFLLITFAVWIILKSCLNYSK